MRAARSAGPSVARAAAQSTPRAAPPSAGALVGLATAAFGTRAIQGLLHGVQPVDPITFAAAGAALLVLATLAASVPASQAEKVNPVDALRED